MSPKDNIFTQAFELLLSHQHQPTAAAFVASQHSLFHSSIIPQVLAKEERSDHLLDPDDSGAMSHYTRWMRLFRHSHTLQFSPLLILRGDNIVDELLNPLIKNMKYFSSTLQRCIIRRNTEVTEDFFDILSQIRTLSDIDFSSQIIDVSVFLKLMSKEKFPSLTRLKVSVTGRLPSKTNEKVLEPSSDDDDSDDDFGGGLFGGGDDSDDELDKKTKKGISPLPSPEDFPHSTTLTSLRCQGYTPGLCKYFPRKSLRTLSLYQNNMNPCTDLQEIVEACPNLEDLTLTRIFPEKPDRSLKSLTKLEHLRKLSVQYRDLTGFPFTDDEDGDSLAHRLTELSLSECSYHIPFQDRDLDNDGELSYEHKRLFFHPLSNCINLVKLDLSHSYSHNNYTFAAIQDLVNLRELDLSSTSISRFGLFYLRKLKNLEVLSFASTNRIGMTHRRSSPLEDDEIGANFNLSDLFSCLPKMRKLDFSSSGLADEDLVGISALKDTLEELSLNRNQELTDAGMSNLKELVNVRELHLPNLSTITNLDFLEKIARSAPLQTLRMTYCEELEDDSLKIFASNDHFKFLKTLHIDYCKNFTESSLLEYVVSQNQNIVHNLTHLSVSGMKLTENVGIKAIARLHRLETVTGVIDNTYDDSDDDESSGGPNITKEVFEKLKKDLKNCKEMN